MVSHGQRKGSLIYNAPTKRWLKYGGSTFQKLLREGHFDTVLPQSELIKFGRKKWIKKVPLIKLDLKDLSSDVKASILSFMPPELIPQVLASQSFSEKDFLIGYPLDFTYKLCETIAPQQLEVLLRNVYVDKLELYACALLKANSRIISVLKDKYSIDDVFEHKIKKHNLDPAYLSLLLSYKVSQKTLNNIISYLKHFGKKDLAFYEKLMEVAIVKSDLNLFDRLISPIPLDANIAAAVAIHQMIITGNYTFLWNLVKKMHVQGWIERRDWFDDFDWEYMTQTYYELYPLERPEDLVIVYSPVGELYTSMIKMINSLQTLNPESNYEIVIKKS